MAAIAGSHASHGLLNVVKVLRCFRLLRLIRVIKVTAVAPDHSPRGPAFVLLGAEEECKKSSARSGETNAASPIETCPLYNMPDKCMS